MTSADKQTECKIDDCQNVPVTRGWCNAHYLRWLRHGDPMILKHPGHGKGGPKPVDNPAYSTLHKRLRTAHGDPGAWICFQCEEKQAQEWALSPTATDVTLVESAGAVLRISVDNAAYMPLCKSCHRRLDRQYRRLEANSK